MGYQESRVIAERIDRLLAIPAEYEEQCRISTAQRASRRTAERQRDAREAAIRKALLTDPVYREQCQNKDERDAYFEHVKHSDEAWDKLQRRLEQLAVAIDKSTSAKEVLDHERKGLKAALEREYARVIEEAISDQTLSRVVSGAAA